MKLKNNEIIALVNAGLLNTTEHDVPAADAYKSYKFRKAVEKAFNAIAEKDRELPKTAGVEDGKEPTEEQTKKIVELRVALYNDETELEGNIVPMSWEGFHALANENKRTAVQVPIGEKNEDGSQKYTTQFVDVFRACESIIEGVLFKVEE
jgi:hypothetical protein